MKLKYNWILSALSVLTLTASCAKMGSPDGGWYDETPPRVVAASPADRSTNVDARKIKIYFDEYVTLDNASEKVVVSPPQLETPEIKGMGKYIQVTLKDSLKQNTTYTVDFSDAIFDNNESNPLGNYTYTFSTGDVIDTLEVSGCVLESENLEPIKGILVGLYANQADSAFTSLPMLRVSRTDSRGHFTIKGVAPGSYRIYALQDADGNYMFNQKSEKLAFSHDIIVPSAKPDIRQDTTWVDSLHIKSIDRVPYTHFLPDDIVLRAFTEEVTDRYFLKYERKDADHFTLFFTHGADALPEIKGLNFNSDDAFVIESNPERDTVTYWIKDTALVNQDTLRMQLSYLMTDTAGVLQQYTDSAFEALAKTSYKSRQKQYQKNLEKWQKEQDRLKKAGEPYDSVMPRQPLAFSFKSSQSMRPDQNVYMEFEKPLQYIDTAAIHLYAKHDTLWYRAPFEFREVKNRYYEIRGEWRPEIEYSLEIDSAAFKDIYGNVSDKDKLGFKIKSNDEFSTLFLNITSLTDSNLVVQLLDGSDKVVRQTKANNGVAEFFYLEPGKYYVRLFVDHNDNGIWDTGCYGEDRQAEEVYYYPGMLELRAKWDLPESWDPLARPLNRQKPSEITKQKPDKEKKVKNRNAERAKKLGIEYIQQK